MPPVPPQAAALSAPSRREYAAMLLPFILSTVTQPLIGAVDTAVMGRLSDPSYIAGVAVGAVIFNTLYWLLGFLRVGSTGFSAQALATGDTEAAWKAFLLPGIMALLLGTLILLCRDAVFSGAMFLLRLDPAAREVAGIYYDILIWTAPLTLLNYAILGWLMGQARIRASLLMQIGGNAVNMLLDLLFVSLFGWGVPGVAAASVLACLFATITGLVAMRDSLPPLPAPLPSLVRVGEMLRMARVNGNLFLRTVCLLTQTNIFMATASTFGTTTLSANAVLVQILLVFTYVFEGIANASSVFAGKARGGKNPALMKAVYRMTLGWTAVSGLAMTGICLLWHTPMLSLFTDLEDVILAASALSFWSVFFPLVSGPGLTVYGLFTGASVTRPVFVSTLQALLAFLAVWVLAVPALGNHGLWLAYTVFYLGRSVFLLPHFGKLLAVCTPKDSKDS